ncbi:hypothetical protein diail_7321 [Diaporthe ilicicola]|nr:hypothetical protein diail_7321 [Diaporthe ilicicola]
MSVSWGEPTTLPNDVGPDPNRSFSIKIFNIKPFLGFDGPWHHEFIVHAFSGESLVAKIVGRLIKEDEYTGVHKHFFSAVDDAGDDLSDLAHLMLWSERRFSRSTRFGNRKMIGISKMSRNRKMQLRRDLDRHWRESRDGGEHLMIRSYCEPALYKAEPFTSGAYAFPQKITWAVYFGLIEVSAPFRHFGIGRTMVALLLDHLRDLAKGANRRLLAAVHPRYVWNMDGACYQMAEWQLDRADKFWLAVGFQKFTKTLRVPDGSNWYFWSDCFDLPGSGAANMSKLRSSLPKPSPPLDDVTGS